MNSTLNTHTSRLGLHVIVVVEQSHKLIITFKNTLLALIFNKEELLSGVF
jgi:hypothetical protein